MKTLQVLLCLVFLVVAYASNAKRASYGVAAEDDSAAVEKRWAYGKPVEKRQWYGRKPQNSVFKSAGLTESPWRSVSGTEADNSKAEKRQWYNVNDDEAKVQKRWAYGKPVEKRQYEGKS
ncbi:hypothetical protein L596_016525 [Steinernema carpocapsae]|uniref:Uncharacterized protein n=1 Tax=Steinernema carpocapsae TaxID=34508 RepID=A0A4U5NJE3_STECR|nr:hypothetical protein L596_016525 [Steinernema carpocapsae]